MWWVVVMVWVLCGFIAMTIGEAKGRSRADAFGIGFIGGPVGIVLLAVLPTPEFMRAASRRVKCPRCDARQNVRAEEARYECWRCHQHVALKDLGS